jgi:hypothetical protein
MAELRYVVLHHTQIAQPHYDFLFELEPGSALAAVRCGDWPPNQGTQFERIKNHRRAYLEYEGEISGGRGHVRRVASGTCKVTATHDDVILVALDCGFELRVPRESKS